MVVWCVCAETEATFNLFKRRKSGTVETPAVDQDHQEPEPVAKGLLPEAEVSSVMVLITCRRHSEICC